MLKIAFGALLGMSFAALADMDQLPRVLCIDTEAHKKLDKIVRWIDCQPRPGVQIACGD